jgi:hypothetical protein
VLLVASRLASLAERNKLSNADNEAALAICLHRWAHGAESGLENEKADLLNDDDCWVLDDGRSGCHSLSDRCGGFGDGDAGSHGLNLLDYVRYLRRNCDVVGKYFSDC